MKLCKDCDHNDRDGWVNQRGCLRLSKQTVDPVEGRVKVKNNMFCFTERADAKLCGPAAKYYVRIWWKWWRPR